MQIRPKCPRHDRQPTDRCQKQMSSARISSRSAVAMVMGAILAARQSVGVLSLTPLRARPSVSNSSSPVPVIQACPRASALSSFIAARRGACIQMCCDLVEQHKRGAPKSAPSRALQGISDTSQRLPALRLNIARGTFFSGIDALKSARCGRSNSASERSRMRYRQALRSPSAFGHVADQIQCCGRKRRVSACACAFGDRLRQAHGWAWIALAGLAICCSQRDIHDGSRTLSLSEAVAFPHGLLVGRPT